MILFRYENYDFIRPRNKNYRQSKDSKAESFNAFIFGFVAQAQRQTLETSLQNFFLQIVIYLVFFFLFTLINFLCKNIMPDREAYEYSSHQMFPPIFDHKISWGSELHSTMHRGMVQLWRNLSTECKQLKFNSIGLILLDYSVAHKTAQKRIIL